MDEGDGTYTRQITISPWNVAHNGIKSLQISAMDFGAMLHQRRLKLNFKTRSDLGYSTAQ